MTEFIEAPVPYIIGVSRKIWIECCLTRSEELASDVIVFEVDKDYMHVKEAMPPLPQPFGEHLLKKLSNLMEQKE